MSDLISRRAAIKAIDDLQNCYNGYSDTYDKACIIGVLEEVPSIDAVSRGVLEQVMWERDLAISQLNEIGKSWGEKMDNVATVVRCKDCISFDKEGICQLHEINRSEDDYCSDGKMCEVNDERAD